MGVDAATTGSHKPRLRLDIPGLAYGASTVLGPVALAVRAGECVALLGPSGVGKTTLLRVAAGLTPADGTVERAGRLSMVFQEPNLLPWRTARDNIALLASVDGNTAEAALADVGLAGRGAAFPRQLSLGQQRRLALARAFAARPELVLLDEPFASLDEATRDDMLALAGRLLRESDAAALLVTHSRVEARIADRTLTLEGQPATLREPKP